MHQIKKVAVATVLRRNNFFVIVPLKLLAYCSIFLCNTNAYADEGPIASSLEETVIKAIYSDTPTTGCTRIGQGPKAKLENIDSQLNLMLHDVLKFLSGDSSVNIHKLFHKRTRVKKRIGKEIQSILKKTLIEPFNFSIYRIWTMYSEDLNKHIHQCEEGVSITSLYGYKVQFGVWIQVLARNELARIYVSIVPNKSSWKIAGFHIQQWTHLGKDFEAWTREALEDKANGQTVTAWTKFDTAQKMLFGGDFLSYTVRSAILENRDQTFSREKLRAFINNQLNDADIAYVGSMLGSDGAGLLIRERLKKEISVNDMKARCNNLGRRLIKVNAISNSSGGIYCGFLAPREDPTKDGALGGFFIPRKQLL